MNRFKSQHLFSVSILLVVAFAISGCSDKKTVKKSGLDVPLINNDTPVPYDEVPDGFTSVSKTLLKKPLDKAKPTDSPTMMTSVTDSGIKYHNTLSRREAMLFIETGAGVALGDYDNDGLIDVYMTGSDIDNRLFRNLGDFKFEDVTDEAGVDGRIQGQNPWASGASFADIDNDGDLDLYVCNMATENILYINQNDGTFKEQTIFRGANYAGGSKQANFCDYDRDGDLDLYLVTYQDFQADEQSFVEMVDGEMRVRKGLEEYAAVINNEEARSGEKDIFLQNQGDGTFKRINEQAGIGDVYEANLSSVWFDFDDDGWQDLYITSDFKLPDHLYRNNRDGTFTDILKDTVRHTPWFAMGLDAGDLNNDGYLDLMVGDMADRTHYGQKVNMGDMAESGWFLVWGAPRQFMHNCVFINSGTGKMMESGVITGMSKTDWTWSIRMVDLDCDGNLDVHVTNGHARDSMNGDLFEEMRKLKESKDLTPEKWGAFFDNIKAREGENLVYKNKGNLEFESVGPEWGMDHMGVSHAAGFADLDNDGDLDAIVNNYYEPSTVYRNDSTNGSRVIVQMRSDSSNRFCIGGKVEILQDGKYYRRDLMPNRGYLSSNPMALHFGLPANSNIELMRVTWPDGTCHEFKDLAVDHIYRAIDDGKGLKNPSRLLPEPKPQFVDATTDMGVDFVYDENDFDDFIREPLLPFQLSKLGGSLAWSDVNGDGFQDVFCSGAAGQAGQLLINENGKQFRPVEGPWASHTEREDMGVLFFDADQDGDDDLYVASGSNEFDVDSESYRDRLYLNNGMGSFTFAADALPDLRDSSSSVSAADFDRDGDLDLFVGSRGIPARYPLIPTSRLLVNEGGKFKEASADVAGDLPGKGLVNSAIWSDYNNDGWVDLLLALEWGPVAVFENKEGKLRDATADAGIGQRLGWWHGIAAGDLDADGDMDYVVTNQGNNTKYHTSVEHPHRLYYDDFDQNGSLDLVEAEFEGDTEYPVRGRSCSSRCMPFIAEKFTTFHDFSKASLSDIYETDKKERPFHEVNILESSILRNQGDGTFKVEPLDRLAQGSPAYGVAIEDFDGDSKLDVMLANNFFGSQPETGYMDGGLSLFLKGDGNTLSSVWPSKSGVSISCDSNGLGLADIDNDGQVDAMFAVNDEPYRIYKNDSAQKAALLIRLVGRDGNAKAIGAKVVLEGETSKRVAEITAGGSYLSQSAIQGIRVGEEELATLKSVSVQWPDGSTSEADIANAKDGVLVISAQP
jgi:hypothetical protein